MIRVSTTPAPDTLAVSKRLLFEVLCIEALALFVARLAATLQFDNFAFFDTGSNLTAQYLINRGYRPTLDFVYHYGLLPLLFGRIWFRIGGLTPLACVVTIPLIDLLIICGLVRFAANLRMNLAGVLLILLTASLIIPSSFLNLTHALEPVFLVHALADQASGNRRRALTLAVGALFVKPSMAYFLGLVLLAFIVIDAWRARSRPLHAIVAETWPAALTAIAIAAVLAASFGVTPVFRSILPNQGLAMYLNQGFGFFNGAGRSFLAPQGAPWSYYLANVAGPWIAYTVVLVVAALFVTGKVLGRWSDAAQGDRTAEVIVSCAFLHLSFIGLFFGNEFSWIYYFYIPVLGVATAARLGVHWELLVGCLAFAVPLSKADKRIVQYLARSEQRSHGSATHDAAPLTGIPALPVEPGFSYQLWFTTSASWATAGLWATPAERDEWLRVLTMIRGHRTSLLVYYGCADLLFAEFRPPVTLFLVAGGVTGKDLSQKLAQLQDSAMIVMPRWHRGLLDEIPAIGDLVRRNFVPTFQGRSFIVYARRAPGQADFLRRSLNF